MDPDMVLAATGSGCHHCPRCQCTPLRWAPKALGPSDTNMAPDWVATCPLVITGASDINRDPGCSKATDPDMALSCSSGLDVTMALHSCTGHSDLHASWTQIADLPLGIHTALSGNRRHACSPRPWRLQGHRPRHGPQQQSRPGCHHEFRWPQWQSGLWTPT